MVKVIRGILIGVLSVALIAAALFAGKGVVQMVSDIRYGVEVREYETETARTHSPLVRAYDIDGFMHTYVNENKDNLLNAAQDFLKCVEQREETRVARLDNAEKVILYTTREEPLAWVESDAMQSMFAEGTVQAICREADGAVSFYVSAAGNVTASVEFGFYYSPENVPMFIDVEPEYAYLPFIEEEGGWWVDRSGVEETAGAIGYTDAFYTERIAENFFYYELYCG